MTHSEAKVICGVRGPSEVSCIGGVVEGGIRDVVPCVESPKRPKVIELLRYSARCCELMISAEVATVGGIGKQRQFRSAASGSHAHNPGQGIGAIERAVGLAQHFDLLHADGGEVRKIDCSTDAVHRHPIN